MATDVSIIEVSPKRVNLSVNATRPLVNVSVGTSIGNTTVTASNIGAGTGIFSSKVGNDFQFKSLIAGTNIVLTPSANSITVGVTGLVNPFSDFNSGALTSDGVADSFDYTTANSVIWEYEIVGSGVKRTGIIAAGWTPDGASIDYFELETTDIGGAVTGVDLGVDIAGGNARLLVTVSSGSWVVRGSRRLIPTNGNGTGPISDSLAQGKILIGSTSNVATAQTMYGHGTLAVDGLFQIAPLVITNSRINASAAIQFSKMEVLTAGKAIVTSGLGVITTAATTATEIGHVSGVTSPIQTQLNNKVGTSLAQGALFIGNASNLVSSLTIGAASTVLTSNGTTASWQALPSGGITVSGGTPMEVKVLQIGDWNMDTTGSVSINHGLTFSKIRDVQVMIYNDAGTSLNPLDRATVLYSYHPAGLIQVTATQISLFRDASNFYDNTDYDATSYNRGWITILYEV